MKLIVTAKLPKVMLDVTSFKILKFDLGLYSYTGYIPYTLYALIKERERKKTGKKPTNNYH